MTRPGIEKQTIERDSAFAYISGVVPIKKGAFRLLPDFGRPCIYIYIYSEQMRRNNSFKTFNESKSVQLLASTV